jgi:hypothetical protein
MKPIYKSWTLWFNLAMLVVTTMNELAKIVPISPEFMGYVTIAGNILLRFKTTQGLEIK